MPSPSSEAGKEIHNPHLLQNMLSKHSSQDKGLNLPCKIRKATCTSYDEIYFFLFSPGTVPPHPFLSQGLLPITHNYLGRAPSYYSNYHTCRQASKIRSVTSFLYLIQPCDCPLILLQPFPTVVIKS